LTTNRDAYEYVILYITPEDLIRSNDLLRLQWENLKTLVPCFLKCLYTGSIDVRIHDFDRIFTGIINLNRRNIQSNVLGKVASLWYYLTKVFHQSIGPREGNFAEELIANWIESSGVFSEVYRNITLGRVLKDIVGVNVESKSKIDFVLRSRDGGIIAFIELRMSEHTGGRTAQESLLDKMVKVLELLEHPRQKLREKLVRGGTTQLDLSIAILFSEQHELLTVKNYSKGRLSSLVSYIMEDRHVWGMIKKLLEEHGYRLCKETSCSKNVDISAMRNTIKNALLNENARKVCIESSDSKFKIWINILFGDEFFRRYAGLSLNELLVKYKQIIADDIWLFYTLTINELKIAQQFGQTNVRKVYEVLEESNFIERFSREVYKNTKISLRDYIAKLNEYVEKCASAVLEQFSKRGEELRLLETNDAVASYEYLKQVCIGALSTAIHIKEKSDPEFRLCNWMQSKIS